MQADLLHITMHSCKSYAVSTKGMPFCLWAFPCSPLFFFLGRFSTWFSFFSHFHPHLFGHNIFVARIRRRLHYKITNKSSKEFSIPTQRVCTPHQRHCYVHKLFKWLARLAKTLNVLVFSVVIRSNIGRKQQSIKHLLYEKQLKINLSILQNNSLLDRWFLHLSIFSYEIAKRYQFYEFDSSALRWFQRGRLKLGEDLKFSEKV